MLETQTDAHLVALALADDTAAFNLLIERYQVMLLCIALRYVTDEEVARELVQEALLQAFLSLDQLRDATRFKSWLYGIVLNICRNWLRERKGNTLSLDASRVSNEHLSTISADPQQLVEEHELQQIVREAVSMLSVRNRSVMQLFYYEYLSMQEIARQLGISLAAVKSRLHKGREQLRAHLETMYPELAYTAMRKGKRAMMIPMKLAKVLQREKIYRTILVLLDEQQQRALPLWFSNLQSFQSSFRAQRPATQKTVSTEPLTADFIVHILDALGGTVEEVGIDVLQGDILYARVQLRTQENSHIVKARLDDALPLALHLNSPFVVADEVLAKIGVSLEGKGETLEQQLDAVASMIDRTPIFMNSQPPITSGVPRNLDFSQDLQGWITMGFPMKPKSYDIQVDPDVRYNGKSSLAITLHDVEESPREIFMDSMVMLLHEGFLADSYQGQRLRMIAYAKAEAVKYAIFNLTVMGPETEPDSTRRFHYMTSTKQKPVEGTDDWTRHELVIDIPDDANSIQAGFNMNGQGKVWLDAIRFEVVDKSVPLTSTTIMPPPQQPENLNFVQGLEYWDVSGNFPQDYICDIDYIDSLQKTAYIKAGKLEPRGSAILQQTISAYAYRDKRIRLSGTIKAVDVEQQAGLFMKIAGLGKTEEMIERTIQGTTDWQPYEILLDVPDKNSSINFGLTLHGKGQIWLKDVHLDVVGSLTR